MGEFQPWHWVVILVIALIVFGPSKLQDLGPTLGKTIKGFRQSMKEPDEETPESPKKPPNNTH